MGGDSDDAAADMNSEVFARCKGGSEEPCSKRLTVALPRKISTSQISMLTKSVAQLSPTQNYQSPDQLVSNKYETINPGHGPVVSNGPKTIRMYIDHRLEHKAQIVRCFARPHLMAHGRRG